MKAKKKLLIGTAIMALAAGGASAVSTFAWYQAGQSGSKAGTGNATQDTLTAVNPEFNVATDLPITVAIKRVGDLGVDYTYANEGAATTGYTARTWRDLELGEWLTAGKTPSATIANDDVWSEDGLWHAYYKASDGKYHYKSSQLSPAAYYVTASGIPAVKPHSEVDANSDTFKNAAWAEYAVVVSAQAVGSYNVNEVASLLEDSHVKVNVNRLYTKTNDVSITAGKTYYTEADGVYTPVAEPAVGQLANYYETSSRAMFFDLKANTTAFTGAKQCSLGAGETSRDLADTTLNNIYSGSAAQDIVIAHFGLYVNGEDNGTRDTGAVQADFKVTVTGIDA